ncbi:MAG: DUF3048 domain-containing protein [Chloroflexota bacterium]
MKTRLLILFLALLGLVSLMAACGGNDTVSELPPPPTASESQPTEAPTLEPVVEHTPAPVVVENATLPPPPTVEAIVVETAAPPTPEITPEPTSLILEKPEDFANRNPFTGELEENPEDLNRRPIAIKIANAPADYTRPQSGLNDADIIFEHWTEGAVTRFTALFYDTIPEDVGPVRSARLIDLELPAMYDAMLAFSGASVGVNQRLNASDFSDRLLRSSAPGFYRTGDETKPFEHTLYVHLDETWDAIEADGLNNPPRITTYNAFTEEPPEGGTPATDIFIDYKTEKVEWRWDEELGKYRRWMDFEEHIDANTEEQVTAANVIYLTPYHVNDPEICEQINDGVCAALSIEIQLWGSGPAIVFRDGQQYEVTWHREGRGDMLTFTDANGNPFPLQIGNSWVQIVPGYLPNSLTVE